MANPFDQFDGEVNPFDTFDEEDVGAIPGTPKQPKYVDTNTIGDKLLGAGEAALSVATSIPASVVGSIAGVGSAIGGGDMDKTASSIMEAMTYAPRTEKGQEYGQATGEAFQQLFPNLVAMNPMGRMRPLGKKGKPEPVAKDLSALDKPVKPVVDVNPFDMFDSLPEDQRGRASNQYIRPDIAQHMPVDENGIPYRKNLSEDVALESRKAGEQMNLFDDPNAVDEYKRSYDRRNQDLAALDQADMEARARKPLEIEMAFREREQQKANESKAARQEKMAEDLTRLEQTLREQAYKPEGNGQGPKTRAFNRGMGRKQGGAIDFSLLDSLWRKIKGDPHDLGALHAYSTTMDQFKYVSDDSPMMEVASQSKYIAQTMQLLPQYKSSYNKEFVRNLARKQEIPQVEKQQIELILSAVPGDKITAKELMVGFNIFNKDVELGRQQTDQYANYGLSAIDRHEWDVGYPGQPGHLRLAGPEAITNLWRLPNEVSDANHFGDPYYYGHTRNFMENGVRHVVEVQSDLAQRMGKTLSSEERADLEQGLKFWQASKKAIGMAEYNFDKMDQVDNYGTFTHSPEERLRHFERGIKGMEDYVQAMPEVELDRKLILGDRLQRALRAQVLDHRSVDRSNNIRLKIINKLFETYPNAKKYYEDYGFHEASWFWDSFVAVAKTDALHLEEKQHIQTTLYRIASDLGESARVFVSEIEGKLKHSPSKELADTVKNWPQRLIREELYDAASNGESVVRFADADTVAKVEQWPDEHQYARTNIAEYQRQIQKFQTELEQLKDAPNDSILHDRAIFLEGKIGDTVKVIQELESRLSEPRFDPQYQGIYDRYKKDITKYLETMGGKHVVDDKGHGWIEVPVRNGPIRLHGQRGAIDINALGEGFKKLMGLSTKNTPELAKLAEDERKRKAILGSIDGLDAYRPNVDSPEKVVALVEAGAKDITPAQKFTAKSVKPGIRSVRVSTNHPLINFVGERTAKVITAAENLARLHITGKNGIGPLLNKMTDTERIEVHQLLMKGDKEERFFSQQELTDIGFSDAQKQFISKFYEMEKIKLDTWNEARLSVGMKPVRERPGHFPGVFRGDYKSLVIDKEGKVIGYIGTDTKLGYNKVVEQIKQKYPDVTITRMQRSGLAGTWSRGDLFSGMSDLIAVLAKNDPRIADIQQAVQAAMNHQSDNLYGASKHSLEKKGIWGNEGNKPWQTDQKKAAREAMEAYFRYWEEGMLSHLNMPVEAEIKALLANPALDNQPRAKEYVDKYYKHLTGRGVGEIGMALNAAIDALPKALWLGPSVTRGAVNQFTKRMGQKTQGFFNIPFTVMQWLQVTQTGYPEFLSAASKLGKDVADVGIAHGKAFQDSLQYFRELIEDKKIVDDPQTRAMFEYAESRGLLTFSEFDDVNKITQNKFSRKFDAVTDFNRVAGEKPTRPLVFFTFVRLLEDSQLPKEEVFDTAYNLTQHSMYDYHSSERPLMYKDLGVVGQMAGSLSQFKHSYIDQMAQLTKRMHKEPMAWVAAMTAAMVYAGYKGMPGYQDADEIVKFLTDKFGNKQRSISDILLENAPKWLSEDIPAYGLMSQQTDVNLQNRLGMADTLPNSALETVSPYAKNASQMVQSLYELGTGRNPRAPLNAALAWAPSSARGLIEDKYSTSGNGMLINKNGQNEYQRTDKERALRRWGLTGLQESKKREGVYNATDVRKADEARRAKLAEEAVLKFTQIGKPFMQSKEWQAIKDEYVQRGGDPNKLIEDLIQGELEQNKTAKQRAEGINPNSLSSVRRYEYYNK